MTSHLKALLAAASVFAFVSAAYGQSPAPQSASPGLAGGDQDAAGLRNPVHRTQGDVTRATVADGFSFAASGDLLGPYNPLTPLNDPELNKVFKILQTADVAFANHEGSAFDLPGFAGTHAAQNGGGYPRIDTAIERDFKAMGLKMVSMANNHAGDWGPEGIIATLANVNAAGLVEAGAGGSLTEARRAGVVRTPRGTVGLIATASTFNPSTPAADAEGALKPRPGVNALRTRSTAIVSESDMAALRALGQGQPSGAAPGTPDQVTIGTTTFKPGTQHSLTYEINPADRDAVLKSVTDAKYANDMVVFSIHAHETDGSELESPAPAFLPELFHKAIDAGADVVVRHGPHVLNGIEIYKGKPIFYSLGSLFFGVGGTARSLDGVRQMPNGSYENAIAVTEFKNGKPSLVRIYPLLTLLDQARPATFGASILAPPADAARILQRIQRDSQPYGTDIKIENGIGVIHIAG